MTISAFSDELAQVRTKKKEFLSQIERIVPWGEWLARFASANYKGEQRQQTLSAEIMLRLYLLQNLYDLSDEATVARQPTPHIFGVLRRGFQQSGSGRGYSRADSGIC